MLQFKHNFVILLMLSFTGFSALRADEFSEKEFVVSVRMIGDQMLRAIGDSNSRVLPVKQENGSYILSFEKNLSFDPELLIATSDSVLQASGFALGYLVEVLQCDSQEVVHSFKVGAIPSHDVIPCKGRYLYANCYQIVITPELPMPQLNQNMHNVAKAKMERDDGWNAMLWTFGSTIIGSVGLFWWMAVRRRKQTESLIDEADKIGNYQFDAATMKLCLKDSCVELSSKENDLLALLLKHVNDTVKRELILQKVWGNEGDYIGRTLDVFVSKLRKKLEGDPKVKITNIRGVGYRLIVEE